MKHDKYTVRAISRAFCIIEALVTSQESLKLDELASATGLNRSTVYRILMTLEEERFVEHDELMRYQLGMRCIQLGGVAYKKQSWNRLAQEITDRICSQTGESVSVHTRSGWEVVCVSLCLSKYQIQHVSYIGRTFPLYHGASGKVIMAFLPKDELKLFINEILLKSKNLKQKNIDIDILLDELATIRQQGYSVSSLMKTEVPMDGVIIAAPIRNIRGSVIAALSIAGPFERMDVEVINDLIPIIIEGADQISTRLGFIPNTP